MKQRIDRLLIHWGLFESRSRAAAAIEAGLVKANGRVIIKASELVDEDAVLEAAPAHPWVGRGALKLDHALSLWPVRVEDRIVLDVGASTGGFTEVCLNRGARHVVAVDVGRGQLHDSLTTDPRVTNLEATDARDLTPQLLGRQPDLIVCDASFIGVAKVLPVALGLAAPGADLIALVKPQFEVGPALVGKSGLVKDEATHAHAIAEVCGWLEGQGWTVRETAASPIEGGNGQREYLLWAFKRP